MSVIEENKTTRRETPVRGGKEAPVRGCKCGTLRLPWAFFSSAKLVWEYTSSKELACPVAPEGREAPVRGGRDVPFSGGEEVPAPYVRPAHWKE